MSCWPAKMCNMPISEAIEDSSGLLSVSAYRVTDPAGGVRSHKGAGVERRRDPRVPYYARVSLRERDEHYFHPAHNLSLGGLFLQAECVLPMATPVELELPDPRGGQPLRLLGQVAWRQLGSPPSGHGPLTQPLVLAGMGIQFAPLDEQAREQLHAFILHAGAWGRRQGA